MFKGYQTALVRTVAEFERVRPRFEVAPIIALDFETVSLDDLTVVGIPMAIPRTPHADGLAIYIGCESDCELDFHTHLAGWLEGLLASEQRETVGHNLKFDTNVMRANGFRRLPSKIFDTMVASWMLHNDELRHNLEAVAGRVLGLSLTKDLMEIRKLRDSDPDLYWTEMLRYGVGDGVVPLKLYAKFLPKIEKAGMLRPMRELEMPMVPVTGEMELRGFKLDREHLGRLHKTLGEKADGYAERLRATLGDINFDSKDQLSIALFDSPDGPRLDPDAVGVFRGPEKVLKGGRVKPGIYSTKEEILKKFDHPVVADLLEYRGLKKLLGTYVDPFLERSETDKFGRIYTSWNQTGTATGRYSSSGPNMQNLPREEGMIRRAIVPDDGFVLIAADYSQIELRIMAHQCGDPTMIELYRTGQDLHRRTAANALGIPEKEVTKTHRTMAKAINFGYLYGMSAGRFKDYALNSYGVRVTDEQATKFRKTYFETYPYIVAYHDYMRDFIAEHGYAENIIGERRYLPDYNADDGFLRWQAWSAGTNYTIQGSAAALMKIAMLNIYNALKRPYGMRVSKTYERVVTLWGSDTNLAHEIRMIGQVHDELQFEVRKEIAEPFKAFVKHEMETAIGGFVVPIEVEVGMSDVSLESAK